MNESPITNLIHLHCDGELSLEQDATLKRHLESHPDMRQSLLQRIEFEKRLRSRVSDVMKAECSHCPKELLAVIRSTMAADGSTSIEAERIEPRARQPVPQVEIQSNPVLGSGATRRRNSFKFPQRTNIFAVAATLALIAGAVLYGIFGRGIDEVPNRPLDLVASAAIYADEEHGECTGDRQKLDKSASIKNPDEVQNDLEAWLGSPVKIFDLQAAGYEFIGGGHCSVPVADRSAHIMYRKPPPAGSPSGGKSPMLSIFVVPTGKGCHGKICQDMTPGKWYPFKGTKCVRKIMLSTDGRLAYFVVCCKDRDLEQVTGLMAMNISAPVPAK